MLGKLFLSRNVQLILKVEIRIQLRFILVLRLSLRKIIGPPLTIEVIKIRVRLLGMRPPLRILLGIYLLLRILLRIRPPLKILLGVYLLLRILLEILLLLRNVNLGEILRLGVSLKIMRYQTLTKQLRNIILFLGKKIRIIS